METEEILEDKEAISLETRPVFVDIYASSFALPFIVLTIPLSKNANNSN